MTALSIPEAVERVRRDSLYWAPETRAAKLADWLNAYGEPLYRALMALPVDERVGCGVNLFVPRGGTR